MIKKIIEAPFLFVGWLLKSTYGRLLAILLLTALVCLVNYPLRDTEVGVWEVEYTLTEPFSKEKDASNFADYADATGRIDPTAIEGRKIIRRVEVTNQLALITMPFHHVSERRVKLIEEDWNKDRTRKVVRMQVLRVSRGLVLGLDLQGGTELSYRIVTPAGGTKKDISVDAEDMARIIRERINASGLLLPEVRVAGKDRIIVRIPGFDASDVARIKSIITRAGRLEFRLVADKEVNSVELGIADPDTGEAPDGWHWYSFEKEDPDSPGEMKKETLLISDSLAEGEGITGENIQRATIGFNSQSGKVAVFVTFRDSGAFWTLTKNNVGRRLAIILDDVRDEANNITKIGKLHSAPVINEAIMGSAMISGGFTQKTAEELKLVLQSGSLKWPLERQSEQFVGPHQGLKSIEAGRRAITIGFAAVVVFILIYYLKAGMVADFALLLNLMILVAALALRSATLTLPGIAGIMLTVGMSIDANVLIFERIREELKKMAEKPLLKSVHDGHRKALVTILDANLTTLLTGIILHEFGTEAVKGFAITLCYGIVISMFTAVVVTRVVFDALIRAKVLKTLPMLEIVRDPKIPFIKMRHAWLTVSAVVVVAGLAYFFVGAGAFGNRLGIEFRSGTVVQVNLKQKGDVEDIRGRLLTAGHDDVRVQEVSAGALAEDGSKSFAIQFRYVPVVKIKDAARIPDSDAEMPGGAEVTVRTGRAVKPEDMIRRLAEVEAPGCTIKDGPKEGGLFTYVVRRADRTPNAVRNLDAAVRSVFGGELITGDVRAALANDDGTSLLADSGVQQVSDKVIRVALKEPALLEGEKSIKAALVVRLPDVEVKPETPSNDGKADVVLVTTNADDALPKVRDALRLKDLPTVEPFAGVTTVGPSQAKEGIVQACAAIVLALLAIVAYVWFRFEFRFGLAAVAALIHDVSITLGVLALAGIEIDMTVIAALLTIIGYSLNDTIVVFDRIRENRRTVRKTKFPDIVNLSINQTLSRTILTSVTTLIAVLALYFLGGAAIRPFAVTLLVGVVAGTYSSIFIASPVLLMTGEQGALRGPLGVTSRTARPLEGFRETT